MLRTKAATSGTSESDLPGRFTVTLTPVTWPDFEMIRSFKSGSERAIAEILSNSVCERLSAPLARSSTIRSSSSARVC